MEMSGNFGSVYNTVTGIVVRPTYKTSNVLRVGMLPRLDVQAMPTRWPMLSLEVCTGCPFFQYLVRENCLVLSMHLGLLNILDDWEHFIQL